MEKVPEEIVSEIALDSAARAVHDLPHTELGGSSQDRCQNDEPGKGPDTPAGDHRVPEAVDGQFHEIGASDSEDVGYQHHQESEGDLPMVGSNVGKDGLQLLHGTPVVFWTGPVFWKGEKLPLLP